MSELPHFRLLSADQVNTIRQNAGAAEEKGSLTPEQLALIYQQQWFKILVPAAYGGQELPLLQAIELEEELARADGSLGWTVTLCAGAGWFGGFTDPEFSRKIFSDTYVCLAGSGAPTGFAEIVPGGYKVTGKWKHATGVPHATVFTAKCIITEHGAPIMNEDGTQKILSFTFLKSETSIIPGWPYMGMKATGSYPYQVDNVVVPNDRTFKIEATEALINNTLYRYPFMQLAEATLAVNISGMALHFVELAQQIFAQKQSRNGVLIADLHVVKNEFYIKLHQLNEARHALFHAVQESWEHCVANPCIHDVVLKNVSTTAHLLAHAARQAVDDLYPYCGLEAANIDAPINQVWRDMHTAAQHSLLAFGHSK